MSALITESPLIKMTTHAPAGYRFKVTVLSALVKKDFMYSVKFSNNYKTLTWESDESLSDVPEKFIEQQIAPHLLKL